MNREQLIYLMQFIHPEKTLAALAGSSNEAALAAILGLTVATYRELRAGFDARARAVAEELLGDAEFAARVDRLPFVAQDTVIGLGDSITDDYQSWLEILRYLLLLRRPRDEIRVVNAGISGETTAQMLRRMPALLKLRPDWIICLAGTNDAWGWENAPQGQTVASLSETARNLAALRGWAAARTTAKWVWMTPATVLEDKITAHWWLALNGLRGCNARLMSIAEIIRRQPEPVVDLQAVFGLPPDPALLLPDGLHPSLLGQRAIAKALVERLTMA